MNTYVNVWKSLLKLLMIYLQSGFLHILPPGGIFELFIINGDR